MCGLDPFEEVISMQKEDKEKVVAELTERLQASTTLIVADYRGLSMTEIDALRGELLKHGARFSVVKNTLTRRAAEAAGAEALLALLEGPSAIAFLEAGGDPVAAAKAIADAARTTKILTIRGGLLEGRAMSGDEVESLAKLPPADVVRGQVLGAIIAPADHDRRVVQRPAAEPDRVDRRPDRAAAGRGGYLRGRRGARRRGAGRGRARSRTGGAGGAGTRARGSGGDRRAASRGDHRRDN